MKSINFQKILRLFDYFKIAYNFNRKHKELYKPQIILILLRSVFIIISALSILKIVDNLVNLAPSMDSSALAQLLLRQFVGLPLITIVFSILLLLLGSTYVEAGLYKRYYRIVNKEDNSTDFISGANKYFFKFLLGNLLIILFWIIAALPYILLGFITLTIGFSIIPIIIDTFLLVWKVIIVSGEDSIISAFKKSFRFGKIHFIPGFVYVLIQNVITLGSSHGGGNIGSTLNIGQPLGNLKNSNNVAVPFSSDFDFYPVIKIAIVSLLSVVTIITIVVSLVQMIFQIFFGLVTTVLYLDNWQIIDEIDEEEVSNV